jgi:hypothetical protein
VGVGDDELKRLQPLSSTNTGRYSDANASRETCCLCPVRLSGADLILLVLL